MGNIVYVFYTNILRVDRKISPFSSLKRRFTTEGELIDYFNAINKCKPVQPWVDENLILNNLVRALEEAFENRRTRVIRSVGCHRPYISAERIREILRNVGIAKFPTSTQGADAWAETCQGLE